MACICPWIGDKLIEGCKTSVQHLDLFHTGGWPHVQNYRYLMGVDLDTPLGDQISQELLGSHSKCALLEVELHLVLPKEIKGFV